MMLWSVIGAELALLLHFVVSLKYDPEQVKWNLNQNQTATNPLDYWGQWPNHTYHPSPTNWRFPFYTLMLDRFVNGDPTNDDANGTSWEHDLTGTQLRHGGDIKGLQDTLDYLGGMGIKGIYLAGSPLINMPWGADAFSPLDLTLLDPHYGEIKAWRECIDEMHARGMYVILDNTMATLGDLLGFEGYLNVSTPLAFHEHNALWKTSRRYHDFDFNNTELEKCDYPRFWDDYGEQVVGNGTQNLVGCRDSDFDQYGDIAAFDIYPEWQRQLSKFASVQDRLREWKPSVRAKIQHLSCIQLAMLDADGFRMDKGQQITVDAQGEFANHIRECAASLGKNNFFIPGEIVSGNAFGAVYLGRGKEPSMAVNDTDKAVRLTSNNSDSSLFIRDAGKQVFDAACFHYSTYRALTRFLGMDGDLGATGETPVDFVEAWNDFIKTTDLINANTGEFDPRHMYGAQNQDVFRWPTIENGTYKQNLANFITTMLLPGIPMLEWGEEQAFYVLDNTADNYVFGRQSMSSATAWQDHGCYTVGNAKFASWPPGTYDKGCKDEWNSLDHRDPSHPIRNIIKSMFEMRSRYPVLNDGFYVKTLSKQTYPIYLPGSMGTATETGLWSVLRGRWPGVQDFTDQGQGNQSIWLLYSNEGVNKTYEFDCNDNTSALIAPFGHGTTVKNLLYPYDELTLSDASPQILGLENSTEYNGCLPALPMSPWGYKAYVPLEKWMLPSPTITRFVPGHDNRIISNSSSTELNSVPIEFHFSQEMNCESVLDAITISSSTEDGSLPSLNRSSVVCRKDVDTKAFVSKYTGLITGQIPSTWFFAAKLDNVSDGVHKVTVTNVTTREGNASTNSVDNFLFRIGKDDNPIVFPRTGNYSESLLHEHGNGSLYISHKAAGADSFRYSTNWGSSWSEWEGYKGGNTTLKDQKWTGTGIQRWDGKHVSVQYWGRMIGSSDHLQQGDLSHGLPRRYPHMFVHGSFNEYGYDSGLASTMHQDHEGMWEYDFMAEWPTEWQANVWGVTPSGKPDLTRAFGDVDNDTVLDLLSPVSLLKNVVWLEQYPDSPHLAYRIKISDADLRYYVIPTGSRLSQIIIWSLLAAVPMMTALAAVSAYRQAFYSVKFNRIGQHEKHGLHPLAIAQGFRLDKWFPGKVLVPFDKIRSIAPSRKPQNDRVIQSITSTSQARRTILIATLEYDIEDWSIKIKIGGLGVMAQLMSKHLQHEDIVWVIPCVGGVDYPIDQRAKPMIVTILGINYSIQVQYHHVQPNITYVLLDADIFRKQTRQEPYPRRMDDMESAIFYSAWNSCIAETMKRFPIDLYHINDYHGALAPLHILPRTIPCCLSLHNAEFQGLWAIRTPTEMDEVCRIYNLSPDIVRKYIQFGEVFNLLHAGASYLRTWQRGYGAVGVSAKYGKRSFARYPILWGLRKVGSLPNPDPSDVAEWDKKAPSKETVVDEGFEAQRGMLRCQVQQWAGLEVDPDAELCAFVGRWSIQKGIDIIADVFPAILENNPKVQLICVGPVIDIYGRFAALKLEKMMSKYPRRVYSRPEFVALPPFFHSGVEFGLMPSRDEPFGLVAVEFGRKGALCVGSRVGGLGSMPGWWFTIESTTTKHLIKQFKMAVEGALITQLNTRKIMRARSAMQRYPVAQWKETLGILQDSAISLNQRQTLKQRLRTPRTSSGSDDGTTLPDGTTIPLRFWYRRSSGLSSGVSTAVHSRQQSRSASRGPSPSRTTEASQPTLGRRLGPGHTQEPSVRGRPRKRLSKPNPHAYATTNSEMGITPSEIGVTVSSPHEVSSSTVPTVSNNRISRISEVGEDNAGETVLDEYLLTPEQAEASKKSSQLASMSEPSTAIRQDLYQPSFAPDPAMSHDILSTAPGSSVNGGNEPMLPQPAHSGIEPVAGNLISSSVARLNLGAVVQSKKDYKLQNVEPFFDDPTGLYYAAFERKLDDLSGKTSEGPLCVEEFLVQSERDWFNRFRGAKMGRKSLPASPMFRTRENSPAPSSNGRRGSHASSSELNEGVEQFLLDDDYRPPTGLKKLLLRKIGDWPVYSFLLAFGQIIAANSYQITLLTGAVGQPAEKLYVIASTYLITSLLWWFVFRNFQSRWVLATPFAYYGFAFLVLGLAPYARTAVGRGWLQNVATGFYATASSSGAFYFSLNFGSEGSVPVATWSFRACAIQGTQQIYVVLLWFWGSRLNQLTLDGVQTATLVAYGPAMTGITVPIALILWTIGIVLFLGLPDYYRQAPGRVPAFYRSIIRRRVIVWFFVTVIIQNYFLSAPYGRNWKYLWSSQHAPAWAIALLVATFFVGIWALFLWRFAVLSRRHSWILPIFAIGLGAPRWGQMLWGTSGMGLWVPWAGSPVAGALLGRSLWLWLGVLDAIQGVGFGMILLQTLTRFHIVFTLVCAQVLGSIATIVARATAPDADGPGSVFPNLVLGRQGLADKSFWLGLLLQLLVCAGFFKFFRKEQLQKP